jgi:dCMP deaminase
MFEGNTRDGDFMNEAILASAKSTDRSTKVGCVFVGDDNIVIVRGANTFPNGVSDTEERHQRPEKYLWTEHAERNAIYHAAREGIVSDGSRVYLPWFPCMDCARALVQVGVREVIGVKPDLSDPKWGKDFERAETLFAEAGVAVRFMALEC